MNGRHVGPDPLDRGRFPVDPWALVETSYLPDDMGVTETLFAVANGYLGMRGNAEEGRPAFAHGTFLNGFHETWEIRHAEAAFGFARTGQTIVNVPDTKLLKIYVDDEPLTFGTADLEEYERTLDFRDGVLRRNLVWRTPSGKRVRINSTRMVSMTQRHLAIMTLEIEMLTGEAPIVISSQILNRQDGVDEYRSPEGAPIGQVDPRKAAAFGERVLMPRMSYANADRMLLGYQCAHSGMTIAVAADHVLEAQDEHEILTSCDDDMAKMVFRVHATEGRTIRVQKTVAYHSSRAVPVRELSDRCDRTLTGQPDSGWTTTSMTSRSGSRSSGRPPTSRSSATTRTCGQSSRRSASTCSGWPRRPAGPTDWASPPRESPAPATRATTSGTPSTTSYRSSATCSPRWPATPCTFRALMLPAGVRNGRARWPRAADVPVAHDQRRGGFGVLRGRGSAQVHIDADVAHALMTYVRATDDMAYLIREGVDILVETSRMWVDLGFWRSNGERSFHIHGVTGPDEYTTVVNNNLFTNVMARYNLEEAVRAVEWIRDEHPADFVRVAARLRIDNAEVEEWRAVAAGMTIPFDEGLGIHPQDDFFLDREVWDLSQTPRTSCDR